MSASTDLALLRRYGYSVGPLDCGFGPVRGAWVLSCFGEHVSVNGLGFVPTKRGAIDEGLLRIAAEVPPRTPARQGSIPSSPGAAVPGVPETRDEVDGAC